MLGSHGPVPAQLGVGATGESPYFELLGWTRVRRGSRLISAWRVAPVWRCSPSRCAAVLPGLASAEQKTVWLCKPGLKHNPCAPGLDTTRLSNNGKAPLGKYTPSKPQKPKVDCFYIYPTVSDDDSDNSDLSIDPEERSIALYQAARYSQECRVFAPMYRQITLTRLLKGPDTITPKMQRIAYQSALSGWHHYLKNYNHGRPFVLIGHSQGSFTLRRLISDEIDTQPRASKAADLGDPARRQRPGEEERQARGRLQEHPPLHDGDPAPLRRRLLDLQ